MQLIQCRMDITSTNADPLNYVPWDSPNTTSITLFNFTVACLYFAVSPSIILLLIERAEE